MYNWRRLTKDQQFKLLTLRKVQKRPWHSPLHIEGGRDDYLLTGTCYEHRPIIGKSPERMSKFESALLDVLHAHAMMVHAWAILPNHYHALVRLSKIEPLLKATGPLHGRTSYSWNREDNAVGRQTWHNCVETRMKSHAHFMATINYVNHNPVKHRYVSRWQEWPFSSANRYLEEVGPEEAERLWKLYPIENYGEGWDDAGL